MKILCSLKNISLSFGAKNIFKDASLTIHEGGKYGLLGLNGFGKSSLFKIIEEKLIPDTTTPPFIFDKSQDYSVFHVPQEAPIPEFHTTISDYWYLFHPEIKILKDRLHQLEQSSHLDDVKLKEQQKIYEQLEHLQVFQAIELYESYVKTFGLALLTTDVRTLSGGERKKLLLSLGLSSSKKLILWDEPTNHLDLETIQKFETELVENHKTWILITHDRYLLGKVTNTIFHIERGGISIFKGSYQDYLSHIASAEIERQKLLQKMNNTFARELAWMRQGIKARGTRSKSRVENYTNLTREIAELKSLEKKQIDFQIKETQKKTKSLVKIENLCFSYDNTNLEKMFEDLSLNIHKGDKIGLMGKNGIGKTTLLKLIMGEITPQSGEIKIADQLIIRYFEQNKNDIPLSSTPFQYLGEGNDFVELSSGERRHIISYFESFLFNRDDIYKPIETFSGGEKARLGLAKNLLLGGDLWIFDEPTNDLDLETLDLLQQKLNSFEGSLILISHDRAFLESITNKIWLLEKDTHKNISKIETFEAGYSQVKNYLDLLQAEKDITIQKIQEKTHDFIPIKKPSLDAKNTKQIEDDIYTLEDLIQKITYKLEQFDYQNITPQKTRELTELQATREKLEEKLLGLYSTYEKLC